MSPRPETLSVLRNVNEERQRQDDKWGPQSCPDGSNVGNASLAEQAQLVTQQAFLHGRGTWRHILNEEVQEAFAEEDPAELRAELVQVAAVAVAWIEDIDRRAL